MPQFKVHSEYSPAGDQPQAIEKLAQGVDLGLREQVLKGVTGSGKTYTMAKVIEAVQRPTLVLAHNKTLAAQLCEEFREFFPENAVEYFVSYYDYYQPEAYIPHTDTYIEKDASTNEEIDRLRLSATCALLERRDVIVVSSVSCIYGLGEPDDFAKMVISLRVGAEWDRDELLRRLVERHAACTGSAKAASLLANWDAALPLFVKVMPLDYKNVPRRQAEAAHDAETASATEEVFHVRGENDHA